MSASSNGDQSGRRITSRRRAGASGSTSGSISGSDSSRSTRHTASNVSYKNYFDADDNYDAEIMDDESPSSNKTATNSNNDCEITKTIASPGKLSRKQSKASSASNGENNSENIESLISITGLGRQEAVSLLEACNNSVENAVEIHFGATAATDQNKSKSNDKSRQMLNGSKLSSSTGSAAPHHLSNGNGMKTASKRTHNDIDNNDLISVDEDSSSSSSGGINYSNGSYSNGGIDGGENIRAPIPPKIDRLIDYDPYAFEMASQNSKRSRLAFDGFRNMKEEFNGKFFLLFHYIDFVNNKF